MSLTERLLLQVFLIIINAFFAASEIALISLNPTILKKEAEGGSKRAKRLYSLAKDPSFFLSTIQVAITFAGFLASAFAAENLAEYITPFIIRAGLSFNLSRKISIVIITLILSFFTLVLGELVPKRIAQQRPYPVALFTSHIVIFFSLIMKPMVFLLTKSTNLVLRALRMKEEGSERPVTENEIMMMVDAGGESGAIKTDEREWIHNVFEFNDITASDIMTREMVVIDIREKDDEIFETIKETGLSRYPVSGESVDDIIGTINARDFLIKKSENSSLDLKTILREPYLVPESIKANILFSNMQRNKIHIAIVVDEYGHTVGIVTLEDLLEEIVGNIYDEFDPSEKDRIKKLEDGSFLVLGSVSLDEFSENTGIKVEENEDYDTIGGLVLSTLETIPEDGTELTIEKDNLSFHVIKIDERRIDKVIIKEIERNKD